ncbi:hypothetical protein BSKO_08239 [Bryopsis sp. KO-2023]|nr:hypothetical protein BSKO_08239 [Bryopsis sp. KO-2023]
MFAKTNGACVVCAPLVWILLLSPSVGNCEEIAAAATAAAAVSGKGSPPKANRPPLNLGRKQNGFFGCRWSWCVQCDHDKCRECLAGYEWDGKNCTKVSHKRKSGEEKESGIEFDCSNASQEVDDQGGKNDRHRDLDIEKCERKKKKKSEKAAQKATEPNL